MWIRIAVSAVNFFGANFSHQARRLLPYPGAVTGDNPRGLSSNFFSGQCAVQREAMSQGLGPVVMLGVDAASLDVIKTNLHRLPTFQRLLEAGSYHSLSSWGDLVPGSVWPSFASGSPPGEHGIYHHIQWNPNAMRLQRITADWLDYKPFWRDVAAAGKKVCAVDVPMVFPSRNTSAVEILSWASHDQLVPFHCNQPVIERELCQRYKLNPLGYEIPVSKSPTTLKAVRDRLVASARQKGELTRWLLELEKWDLFISVFGEIHRGGHLLWSPTPDAGGGPSEDLLAVYQAVDASLGLFGDAIDKQSGATLFCSLSTAWVGTGRGPVSFRLSWTASISCIMLAGRPIRPRTAKRA